MVKLEFSVTNTENTTQLHKELYDVLLGDKLKAASIELALEEPAYRKIIEDDFLTIAVDLYLLFDDNCGYASLPFRVLLRTLCKTLNKHFCCYLFGCL